MKKLLCILLLLPFLSQAQLSPSIDSLVQLKIDASQPVITFKAGQIKVTPVVGKKYNYDGDIVGLATLASVDSLLTVQLKTANTTIASLTARIAVLEAKPTDPTLAARITAIETKITTGLTITGVAK